MSSFHRILFPTDLSKNAERAYPFACSVARDLGASIIILHVYPPPIDRSEVVAWHQGKGFEEDLKEFLEEYDGQGVPCGVTRQLKEGHAVEEILRVARESKCDLIVMGTHGRTGIARLLMGSVAEQVLRKAPCPVLTVKQPVPPGDTTKDPAP